MISDPDLHTSQAQAAAERRRLAHDPHRPRYHFLPPSGWMNDPNGLIHFGGLYHVFYQHNPHEARWGLIHWGHAVSDDLVHWRDRPIALSPTPGGPDADGCWSGCAFTVGGEAAIMYTGGRQVNGVHQQRPCLAVSHDDLDSFEKYPGNPVIAAPPQGLDVVGFRDHRVWFEGGAWYMLIGSGVRGVGGAALLYRSPDLETWAYLGPLAVGDRTALEPIWTGEMWECADFFALAGTHALLLSVYAQDPTEFYYPVYQLGEYAGHRLTPHTWGYLDVGGHLDLPRTVPQGARPRHGMHAGLFYAPQTFEDAAGRRLLFGWISEGRPQDDQLAAGWAGVLSLPRVLSLGEDGALRQDPAPELQRLRGREVRHADLALRPGEARALDGVAGTALELDLRVHVGSEARFTVELFGSPAHRGAALHYDPQQSRLWLELPHGERGGPLSLAPGEPLELRVFLDRSVIEVFANRRTCLTGRIYPASPDQTGVSLHVAHGEAHLEHLSAWTMRDIWDDAPTR